jgi:hypothetical protein
MRKFKNKTTGIIGQLKEDGHLHFERGDERTTCHESIWFGFVENSCDWEEVVEKDWEILEERASCNIGSNKIEIVSVKRLSDGEVFSLGDRFTFRNGNGSVSEIKGIYLRDGFPWLQTNLDHPTYGTTLSYAVKIKPVLTSFDGESIYKETSVWGVTNTFGLAYCSWFEDYDAKHLKIFAKKENAENYINTYKNYKTVDGKQIKEGNVFYCYDNKRFKCIETKFGQFKASKWDGKRYKTKEEVEELILMNKPCMSLNDLLDAWGNVDDRECYKQSILFNNYKKAAQNKIKNE